MIAEDLNMNRETLRLFLIWRFENEKDFVKNGTQKSHEQQWPERRDVSVDLLEQFESVPGLLNRRLAMRVGFTDKIRRKNVNLRNGAHQIDQDRRKLACRNRRWIEWVHLGIWQAMKNNGSCSSDHRRKWALQLLAFLFCHSLLIHLIRHRVSFYFQKNISEIVEDVKTSVTQAKEEFLGCCEQWKIRWKKCVLCEVAYSYI